MARDGSRLQSSVLTFGPLGRAACTVVVVGIPVWLLWTAGPFGLLGVVVWGGWVMPRALRDTWRRAALPDDELSRLARQSERDARAAQTPERPGNAALGEERPPSRW